MAIAEWRNYITNGALFLNTAELKVANRLPWCVANFKFTLSQSSGKIIDPQKKEYNTNIEVVIDSVELTFDNVPLARGFSTYHTFMSVNGTSLQIPVILPIEALSFIESKRTDDVTLRGILSITCKEETASNDVRWKDYNNVDLPFNIEFSAKKWTTFLSEMGYNEKWIIELDRPKLEGYNEIMEHIRKAQDALYNKREPEDVLRDLRAARDSFKVFYESRIGKIEEQIDKGSLGEERQKSKSERVKEMYEKISNFLNLGPHNDKYEVTYFYAQLAFREFISILAYISSVLSKIPKE